MSKNKAECGARRTVLHVVLAHARDMGAPVHHALALLDKDVEKQSAVIVDDADPRETRLRPVPNADHFAVNGKEFTRPARSY